MSNISNYEDDSIITSQGTIVLEKKLDDYIWQIERAEVEKLAVMKKDNKTKEDPSKEFEVAKQVLFSKNKNKEKEIHWQS